MTNTKDNGGLPKPVLRVLDEWCVGGFYLVYFDLEGNAKTFMKADNELFLIGIITRAKQIAQKMETDDFGGISGEVTN